MAAQQHRMQARKTIAVEPIVAVAMAAAVEETKSVCLNSARTKWSRPMGFNMLHDADNA